MRGLGTLINVVLVIVGSGAGVLIGDRIPERMRTTLLQVMGLVSIAIGMSDAIDTHNMVFPLIGMAIGAHVHRGRGSLKDKELPTAARQMRSGFAVGFTIRQLWPSARLR